MPHQTVCTWHEGLPSARLRQLFTQLRASRADGSYERRLQRFTTPDLLFVDDLGLCPLTGDEPMDLYELIRFRYERASPLFTSNRDADEMAKLFGDPLLVSAAMASRLHHAHVIRIEGESYRNPVRGNRSKPDLVAT